MARIVSIIQFVGKAGNTVGQKSKKGGIILKQRPASVSNPQTNAQMNHRARFKLAAVVAGMLGEVGRVSLQANGFRKSDRGELVRRIMRFVTINGNQAHLNYALHLVNNPVLAKSVTVATTATENGYVATFSGIGTGEVVAKAILVYDQVTGLWRHTSALDTQSTLSIEKDAQEEGHAIEVYAYGIVLTPKTEVALANLSEVDSDGVGYVVNVEGISSENYDFSPTLSALLTVAGSDSQSGNGGNNNQEPAVTANVTITANANDAQMGSVSGGGTYVQGASVTLTATANEGYHFVSWSNGRTTASITVTADADATYTATFAADGQGGSGDNSGMDG